jgi:uncharacterized protein (TIGR02145 family)
MKTLFKITIVLLFAEIFISCEKKKVPPSITTTAITEVTATTAISGGNITSDGGADIITKGICWNTSDGPTTSNNSTIATGGSASFTSTLQQLVPGTIYYVRAFATNSAGTSYGESLSFKTLGDKAAAVILEPTNLKVNSATLNGTLNPNYLTTTVTFEYGTTINYGSTATALQSPVIGNIAVNISADITGLSPRTLYYFRIKAENSLGTVYSDGMVFTTLGQVPTATTQTVTNLMVTTSTLNGLVNPNYLATTTTFEWGLTPSYGNTAVSSQDPGTAGTPQPVSVNISGLSPETTYHYRVKAINSLGDAYGSDMTFRTYAEADPDNNVYHSVTIGTQTWFDQNLRTTHWNNGTPIPLVTDNSQWKNLTTGAYCWYNNDKTNNGGANGALYNWFAVSENNLCPLGWHVPSDADWTILSDYLGGASVAGGKMKQAGGASWNTPNNGADNSSGFTALGTGYRFYLDGAFYDKTYITAWWSTTEWYGTEVLRRYIFFDTSDLYRLNYPKGNGFSVRCLKD